jgi:hypothetical protein
LEATKACKVASVVGMSVVRCVGKRCRTGVGQPPLSYAPRRLSYSTGLVKRADRREYVTKLASRISAPTDAITSPAG